MKYSLFNFPKEYSEEKYNYVISKVLGFLGRRTEILSIYQIGSISNPGISDIDLIAIFKNNMISDVNPLSILNKNEIYPFTHSVFGICEKHFREIQKFTAYHNYKHLWGKNLDSYLIKNTVNELMALKRQIALEFLIANYISRTIEYTYKALNVRSLLLSVKAIKYDLEFLSETAHPIVKYVDELIEMRNNWFKSKINKKNFIKWFLGFYDSLIDLLEKELQKDFLYLPNSKILYSKNILIKNSGKFDFHREGFLIPLGFQSLGKKIFKLNNKFNNFIFSIPYITETNNNLLKDRFKFFSEMLSYNEIYIDNFGKISSSFNK